MELNNWFLSIGTDWYSATHATCNSMQPPNNEAHLRFAPRVTFGGRSGSRQTKILCFRDLSSICWLTPLEMRPYRRADIDQNAEVLVCSVCTAHVCLALFASGGPAATNKIAVAIRHGVRSIPSTECALTDGPSVTSS